MFRPAYRMSAHAYRRMHERHINPWRIIRALERGSAPTLGGLESFIDPLRKVVVIADPDTRIIVTVYRAGQPDAPNTYSNGDDAHE